MENTITRILDIIQDPIDEIEIQVPLDVEALVDEQKPGVAILEGRVGSGGDHTIEINIPGPDGSNSVEIAPRGFIVYDVRGFPSTSFSTQFVYNRTENPVPAYENLTLPPEHQKALDKLLGRYIECRYSITGEQV
jgi:hypothetical protein